METLPIKKELSKKELSKKELELSTKELSTKELELSTKELELSINHTKELQINMNKLPLELVYYIKDFIPPKINSIQFVYWVVSDYWNVPEEYYWNNIGLIFRLSDLICPGRPMFNFVPNYRFRSLYKILYIEEDNQIKAVSIFEKITKYSSFITCVSWTLDKTYNHFLSIINNQHKLDEIKEE